MTAILLDGKKHSEEILQELKKKIYAHNLKLHLSIILVGNDPASLSYTKMKQKRAKEIGIQTELFHFSQDIPESELKKFIVAQNAKTDGILIQLPLPKNFNKQDLLNTIAPNKDVDGLTTISLQEIIIGNETHAPATPRGIISLLEHFQIPIQGKNITIINHSNLIGKPLAHMFLNRNATITICHEFTQNLSQHTKNADILVTAVGKPHLITADMIKQDAVIVDAGVSMVDNKPVGDTEFNTLQQKASYITPTPGGIGPMTIASLLSTLVDNNLPN